MKNSYNVVLFLIVVIGLVIVALIRNNNQGDGYLKVAGFTQGTTYHVTYENKNVGDLRNEIDSLLHVFDLSLSTYNKESVISRINNNEPDVELDEYFITVFKKSKEVHKKTNGVFDLTVGPIINALGFGAGEKQNVDTALIDSLLQYVGLDMVELKGNRIIKEKPGIYLDVNAIAQGYSVDIVSEFLESRGIKNYLVEIGGEIKARGKNPNNEVWKIGLDRPVEDNNIPGQDMVARMYLKDMSLATSGNYRKFYEKDGVKYTHSIDPKTGFPTNKKILSATIFADDCMTADAYATACMVMGIEKAKELIEKLDEISGYLIYSDDKGSYQVYASPEIEDLIIK